MNACICRFLLQLFRQWLLYGFDFLSGERLKFSCGRRLQVNKRVGKLADPERREINRLQNQYFPLSPLLPLTITLKNNFKLCSKHGREGGSSQQHFVARALCVFLRIILSNMSR